MLKRTLLFIFIAFTVSKTFAQTLSIKGVVRDLQTTALIQGATISLQSVTDTTAIHSTASDSLGRFVFADLLPDSFKIIVTSVGYSPVVKRVNLDTASLDVGAIEVGKTAGVLAGVTVTATVPMAVQKGDTVQYNASQFKVNPDATVEDLAKKMPGITVENGQVTAHGETVQKVTIDGRELFGDDATAALRNLPAEIVDKIQVFDRLSDQAAFTGFDDGSSQKGINIITKANMRNGQFGRIFAGYGTDGRYSAGGNTTFLKGVRKLSLVGNFNNINQQNFASQDLLGVTSTSQRSGGGRGGGGGQRGGGGRSGGGGGNYQGGGFSSNSNFLIGQQNGINRTTAAGINYADDWGKKITISGSYFFNNTNNSTNESVNTQYFTKGVGNNYTQNTLANSKNTNHRINMRLDYKIDSANEIIYTPGLSFQSNTSVRNVTTSFYDPTTSALVEKTGNTNTSSTSGNNLNNNLLYRHQFAKRGRTFSVNLNSSTNTKTGDVYTDYFDTTFTGTTYKDSASQRYTSQANSGYQLSANLVYTEPVGKNSQLQLNYNPTYSKSKADQEAFVYEVPTHNYSKFDTTLSNKFENEYKAQSAGLAFRHGTRDNQISFGANFQQSSLHSDQTFPRALTVDKTFNNILPNAMARIKLNSNSNLRIFYRASTNQPSVTQLQDVYDFTNAPFVTAGNPQLAQQYTHLVSTRYTYTNTTKNILFVGNVFFQTASNYITNATFFPTADSVLSNNLVLTKNQQLTKPVNLDGYMNLRSFITFAVPLKFIKSNFNLNGGVTYSKLPGQINQLTNISKNTTYTIGSVIASNVSQYVDFTVSYSANLSSVKNETNTSLNSNYFSHVASIQLNLLSKTGWFYQTDITNQLYNGLSAGYNQNYFLWNMSGGKKFLKNQKGELKLSVFDLLKQNQSITRDVEATYIQDVQNQVLQQYFMLTFTYNLRTFGTGVSRPANSNWGGGGGRMRPPM